MSFFDYFTDLYQDKDRLVSILEELRRRIIWILLVFFILFGFSFYFNQSIFYFISKPIFLKFPQGKVFIYTNLFEAFLSEIYLSTYVAFIGSIPFLAIQIYQFASKGLYKAERHLFIKLTVSSIAMCIFGFCLMYYVIFPNALDFLLSRYSEYVLPQFKIGEYISTFFHMTFSFCVAFQLPIVMIGLIKLGILSVESIKKKRKHIIVLIFIISAIITPPDIPSQVICASIMIIIFELTLFLSSNKKIIGKRLNF